MPFEKGKSGNPGGRPKTKPFYEALTLMIRRPAGQPLELPPDPRVIDVLAFNLVQEAMGGMNQIDAIKQIADRLDGKPAQALEHAGVDGTELPAPVVQIYLPSNGRD